MAAELPVAFPSVEVDYARLDPAMHMAIDRIVTRRSEGSFRIEGFDLDDLETMRSVLVQAEGCHLPRYNYDENGDYIRGGFTPKVEERHTRVFALEPFSGQGERTLWLRVPLWNQEPLQPQASSPEQRPIFTRKQKLGLAVGVVAAEGLCAASLATDKVEFIAGWGLVAGGVCIAAVKKLLPNQRQEIRSN